MVHGIRTAITEYCIKDPMRSAYHPRVTESSSPHVSQQVSASYHTILSFNLI